jgi:hypothetical protein
MAEAAAWCLRAAAAAARSFAGVQQARRSAQPGASAEPVAVLLPEAAAVRYARPEAAAASRAWTAAVRYALPVVAAESQAWAAAVARPWMRAGAPRALAGQAGAVELQQAARLWVARLWVAAAAALAEVAAARRQADAGQRAVRPSAVRPSVARPSVARLLVPPWPFHPDQPPGPWSAPPPSARFAHAMRVPRIAWP